MKEMFGVSSINEDDDAIMNSFQSYSKDVLNELEKYEITCQSNPFPGKPVISDGKNLLRAVIQIQSPMEFFDKIFAEQDKFYDFAEDYEPVKAFFTGEQKNIFVDALNLMKIFDDSKTFVVDEQVENSVAEIKIILKKAAPYSDIPKLPELLNRFREAYSKVLDSMLAPVLAAIKDARTRTFEVLATKSYKEEFSDRFIKSFDEIREKAQKCNNVATLQNIRLEADALKLRLLNEISKKDEQLATLREIPPTYTGGVPPITKPQPVIKKRKNISIKSLNLSASWQIETTQDVDKHMATLREQIIKELAQDTIISIEF